MNKPTKEILKRPQPVLLVVAIITEIVAILIGNVASNALQSNNNECYGTVPMEYVTWLVAVLGMLIAGAGLYIATRSKRSRAINIAAVTVFICLILAGIAVANSKFCLGG